jgi:hypothetical protein
MVLVYDEAAGVVRRPRNIDEKVMIHYSEVKLYDPKWTLKDFALWPQRGEMIETRRVATNIWGDVVLDASGNPTMEANINVEQYTDQTPFPRLYPAMPGDVFTTNTVITEGFDMEDYGAIEALIAAGDLWAVPAIVGENSVTQEHGGYLRLVNGRPTGAAVPRNLFQAVKFYDLPDGQPAIRFEVW